MSKKRYTNRQHLEFVSECDCTLNDYAQGKDRCAGGIQAHHLLKPWDGGRGMSMRANDKNTIPLCFKHHQELHDWLGTEANIFKKYGLAEDYGKRYAEALFIDHIGHQGL